MNDTTDIFNIPEVLNVKEARASFSKLLQQAAEEDAVFYIRGPQNRDVLLLGINTVRKLRESYRELANELVSERETRETLENELAMRALVNEAPERIGPKSDTSSKGLLSRLRNKAKRNRTEEAQRVPTGKVPEVHAASPVTPFHVERSSSLATHSGQPLQYRGAVTATKDILEPALLPRMQEDLRSVDEIEVPSKKPQHSELLVTHSQ